MTAKKQEISISYNFFAVFVIVGLFCITLLLDPSALFPEPESSLYRPLIGALHNFGHCPLFIMISLSCRYLLQQILSLPSSRLDTVTAVICLLLASAIEVIQGTIGRQPSIVDLAIDAGGIGAGLVLYRAVQAQANKQYLLSLLAALIILASSLPTLSLVYAFHQRNQSLPMLSHFGADWQTHFLSGQHSQLSIFKAAKQPDIGVQERLKLRVTERGRWPGLYLSSPYPDWRGYSTLKLSIYSAQPQPLPVTLKIEDSRHRNLHSDRYNRRLLIQPGINRFEIALSEIEQAPEERAMAMSEIAKLSLFMHSPPIGTTLVFENLLLSRDQTTTTPSISSSDSSPHKPTPSPVE